MSPHHHPISLLPLSISQSRNIVPSLALVLQNVIPFSCIPKVTPFFCPCFTKCRPLLPCTPLTYWVHTFSNFWGLGQRATTNAALNKKHKSHVKYLMRQILFVGVQVLCHLGLNIDSWMAKTVIWYWILKMIPKYQNLLGSLIFRRQLLNYHFHNRFKSYFSQRFFRIAVNNTRFSHDKTKQIWPNRWVQFQ